jgi:hypothetical protein
MSTAAEAPASSPAQTPIPVPPAQLFKVVFRPSVPTCETEEKRPPDNDAVLVVTKFLSARKKVATQSSVPFIDQLRRLYRSKTQRQRLMMSQRLRMPRTSNVPVRAQIPTVSSTGEKKTAGIQIDVTQGRKGRNPLLFLLTALLRCYAVGWDNLDIGNDGTVLLDYYTSLYSTLFYSNLRLPYYRNTIRYFPILSTLYYTILYTTILYSTLVLYYTSTVLYYIPYDTLLCVLLYT